MPATAVPPLVFSVKLELVIVVGSIAREKVACGVTVCATPVAPFDGSVAVTVGGAETGITSIAVTSGSSAAP